MVGVDPVIIRKAFKVTKADFCKQIVSDDRVCFVSADKAGSFIGTD